jgi:radical SAM superfamily enzyme YgiQ (UPF0313 family)
LKILLCTVPVESPDNQPVLRETPDTPTLPKSAIIALINWMKKNGYDEKHCDFLDYDMLLPTDAEFIEYLKICRPTIVGLSAVVSASYPQVKKITKIIKTLFPDTKIICGGALTSSANVILNKTGTDICVVGDGEIAWVKLLDNLKTNNHQWNYNNLKTIKGLAYLHENEFIFTGFGEKIPNEEMVFTDYELLKKGLKLRPETFGYYFTKAINLLEFRTDQRTYEKGRKPNVANVCISKGCVARCTFCQRSSRGIRTRDLKSLEKHIIELKEKYDVGFIHVIDENFGSSKSHTYEAAKIFKKHDMLWICTGVRCTSVKFEDVKFYKEAGCCSLRYGIESGSQKILDIMEKAFNVEDIKAAIGYCADLEIFSQLALMLGMPGESNTTVKETGVFVGELSYRQGLPIKYNPFGFFFALPTPGTPLFEYAQQTGVIGADIDSEEYFLENIAGAGADIYHYINLNGSSRRDILFWDFMAKMVAAKTYYKLQKQNPVKKPINFLNSILINEGISRFSQDSMLKMALDLIRYRLFIKQKMNHLTESKDITDYLKERGIRTTDIKVLRNRIFGFISNYIGTHVIFNEFLLKFVPTFILFPIVKNLLHLEFIMQKIILELFKTKSYFFLFKRIKKIPKIDLDKIKHNKKRSDRSLRIIVDSIQNNGTGLSERNLQAIRKGQ